jgi:hypothetical protein
LLLHPQEAIQGLLCILKFYLSSGLWQPQNSATVPWLNTGSSSPHWFLSPAPLLRPCFISLLFGNDPLSGPVSVFSLHSQLTNAPRGNH